MRITRNPRSRRNLTLFFLAVAVFSAVTYGIVTYQTPYGCDSAGIASGPDVDWQVFVKPCIYIYFTGIVGGSIFLILLIPVPEEKTQVIPSSTKSDADRPIQNYLP